MKVLLASVLVLLPLSARAVTIELDPGPVGTSAFILPLGDFNDFNNTPVDGRTLSMDFVFSDMKHVEYLSDSGAGRATLRLFTDTIVATPAIFGNNALLADENGNSVVDAVNVGFFLLASPPALGWQAAFLDLDGVFAHGVHFDVTLPDWTTERVLITGGSLSLVGGQNGTVVVGEWRPSGTAAEPSGLFFLGLALFGWTSRKNRVCRVRVVFEGDADPPNAGVDA